MFIDDRVVKSFVKRIRENLLNLDLDRKFNRIEAAHTLPEGDHINVGGDEDSVV